MVYTTIVGGVDTSFSTKLNFNFSLMAPIGSVTAYLTSFTLVPALPDNWVACNGQVISDVRSPFNGIAIPNLNASGGGTQRFLRGSTTSGSLGGTETLALAHNHGGQTTVAGGYYTTSGGSRSNGGFNNFSGSGLEVSPQTIASGLTTYTSLPSFYEITWIMRIF